MGVFWGLGGGWRGVVGCCLGGGKGVCVSGGRVVVEVWVFLFHGGDEDEALTSPLYSLLFTLFSYPTPVINLNLHILRTRLFNRPTFDAGAVLGKTAPPPATAMGGSKPPAKAFPFTMGGGGGGVAGAGAAPAAAAAAAVNEGDVLARMRAAAAERKRKQQEEAEAAAAAGGGAGDGGEGGRGGEGGDGSGVAVAAANGDGEQQQQQQQQPTG
jgi:hypothetical protein